MKRLGGFTHNRDRILILLHGIPNQKRESLPRLLVEIELDLVEIHRLFRRKQLRQADSLNLVKMWVEHFVNAVNAPRLSNVEFDVEIVHHFDNRIHVHQTNRHLP